MPKKKPPKKKLKQQPNSKRIFPPAKKGPDNFMHPDKASIPVLDDSD